MAIMSLDPHRKLSIWGRKGLHWYFHFTRKKNKAGRDVVRCPGGHRTGALLPLSCSRQVWIYLIQGGSLLSSGSSFLSWGTGHVESWGAGVVAFKSSWAAGPALHGGDGVAVCEPNLWKENGGVCKDLFTTMLVMVQNTENSGKSYPK